MTHTGKLFTMALATAVVLSLGITASLAGVSAEEAARLGQDLTPVGAEKAGNADGTIPAWDGGLTTVAPGYQPGGLRPDPFPGEKPRLSITAANAGEYGDNLSDGLKAMFAKYPDFRMDVYPTHRTAAFPAYVVENTKKNAVSAHTTNNGYSVEGAYGGIPFPIPATGAEAIWNHLLAWHGYASRAAFTTWVVNGGSKVLASASVSDIQYPYYDPSQSHDQGTEDYMWMRVRNTEPPFKAGEAILGRDPLDMFGKGRQAWQYLTGQRRVRKAPSIAYDTPDFVTSGVGNFDEVHVFQGQLDRYDWKLVGKNEMFIPYNNTRFLAAEPEAVLGDHFLNPDMVRWEAHRVWVVEATLASGKRHVVTKRRFYLDEDTWTAHLVDQWDAQGRLWKLVFGLSFPAPDFPATVLRPYGQYNLIDGAYLANGLPNGKTPQYTKMDPWPERYFTPSALAADGVR